MQKTAVPETFEAAVAQVDAYKKAKTFDFPNETLLYLYKYYKQATEGDVQTARPSMLDPIARAKWDSWNSIRGKSKDFAKSKYVSYVQKLAKSVKK